MSAPGFIFSTDGKSAPSYDQLQKRRRVLDAMLARQDNSAPQNVGEGIFAFAQGIAGGLEGRALRREEEALGERQKQLWSDLSALGPGMAGAGYGSATGPIADASETPSGSAVAASELAPHQAALLDTISGPESAGAYDVIYGGSKFVDFSDHPRKAVPIGLGPNQGKTSSAAGRYQFLGSTWDQYRNKLGLQDFSPANQDRAAYALAADTYRQKTGQDLDAVLQSGDPQAIAGVGQALAGVWTSLPGGIEQGTNTNRFLSAFNTSLGRYGSRSSSQGAEPVQVASLDPSAGVAEATAPGRANASIPTMPSTPADVPVPTSAATVRGALERAAATQAQREGSAGTQPYTGPALDEKESISSIAPLGMPGATPETEAAIQRHHADNGTTPVQFRGNAEPGMVSVPGSVADQQADALIAGDPERPIVAPTPTPRPDIGAAPPVAPGGVPPQAVAASAMAQSPSAFDRVAGEAMGGNTGAADAARTAYLAGDRASPATQKIAQVMTERSIPVQSQQPADPARSEAVQRVAVAQAQGQAQGRFGQLMQLMMDPSASPEQKQVASMYLDRDQQLQTQQQARAWEMWKLQDTRAYDERKAERDRINGNADYMTRKRIDQQFERPQIIEVYDPETGRQRKGYMGQDGQFVPVGGVEASKGYRDLTPDEVTRRGLPPGAYQEGPDGKIEGVGKGGITINTGENGSEFTKEGEKSANTRLNDIIAAGQSASAMLGDVQQLADLGRQIGTGKIAQVKTALGPYAEALGIDISKQGEAEAYQAIIARMAPNMRPAGSGATSDFDAKQFLAALPGLGNSLEGNQIITDTFTALSQNKMQAAELASLAYLPKDQGGITWQEAEKRIRALPNPYERFRAMRGQLSRQGVANAPASQPTAPTTTLPNGQRYEGGVPVGGGAQAPAVPQRATNPQTGQVIELRNGQWVPVQ